ncbi:hypothetical protein [Pedobacter sp. NJ-S-72]
MSLNYGDTDNQYAVGKTLVKTKTKKAGVLQISLDHDTAIFNVTQLMNDLMKDSQRLKPYLQKPNHDDPPQYTLPSEILSFTKKTKNFIITLKINTIRFSTDKSNKMKALDFATGTYLIKRR